MSEPTPERLLVSPRHVAPRLPRGWHSRRLPHFDAGAIPQFLTFRLADSIPRAELLAWEERHSGPGDIAQARRTWVEHTLDRGIGACELANPRVARIVEDALQHFDGSRCRLHAWVVMPNHLHLVATPAEGIRLGDLVKSWKGYTAWRVNRELGRHGRFWQPEYFDRFIRNDAHLRATLAYIDENPVSSGLCARSDLWQFGSARLGAERPLIVG